MFDKSLFKFSEFIRQIQRKLFGDPNWRKPDFHERKLEFRFDPREGVLIYGTSKGLALLSESIIEFIRERSKDSSTKTEIMDLRLHNILTEESIPPILHLLEDCPESRLRFTPPQGFHDASLEILYNPDEGISIIGTPRGFGTLADLIMQMSNMGARYTEHIHLEDRNLLSDKSESTTIVVFGEEFEK